MRDTEHLDVSIRGGIWEGDVGNILFVVSDGMLGPGGLSLPGDLGYSNS